MKQYLDLLRHVYENGVDKADRTGVGTRSVFGAQMRFNLADGFPLVTTKKMFTQGMIDEVLWFISGSTNVNDLPERTQHWWRPWMSEDGSLGAIYGEQYRSAMWWTMFDDNIANLDKLTDEKYTNGLLVKHSVIDDTKIAFVMLDQLQYLIHEIKINPDSRRLMINLWNTPAMLATNLPCCHGSIIQCDVENGKLSMQVYQRSADILIGLPVNLASYSLLLMMIAQVCGLEAGELVYTLGNAHIYKNHFEQVETQLQRSPLPLPKMILNKNIDNIFDFTYNDFELVHYQHHAIIKAPVAV